MKKTKNIADATQRLLAEYKGGSMDPIWHEIIDMIDKEVIGNDEVIKKSENISRVEENDMAVRNIVRKKQRELLHDENEETITARGAIALVLDDYRISATTPEGDSYMRTSLDRAVGLIISAIESYVLPKGREFVEGKGSPDLAAALVPLYMQQLEVLGIAINEKIEGAKGL